VVPAMRNFVALGAGVHVWLGFDHEWERRAVGASTPHRLGAMQNWIDDSALHVGMGPGVNGDFAFPSGMFAIVGSKARRGKVAFTLEDKIVDNRAEVSHTAPGVPAGAVLGGLELEMRCLPEAGTCNSNAVWPYRLSVQLGDEGATFQIGRAWTPAKGGGKPLSAAMQYNVTVHWVDLGHGATMPKVMHKLNSTLHKPSGWQLGTGPAALTGFGFELADKHDGKAGRYLEGLAFGARPGADHPWEWRADVWAPRTVYDSPVQSFVELVDLPAFESFGTLNGTVCADDKAFPYSFRCARRGLPRQLEAVVPLPEPSGLVLV